jgi:3-hydroxy-9,10-secoandrosta-1,3,5(10)-triene-9,17-dione monooxygenase reductase component
MSGELDPRRAEDFKRVLGHFCSGIAVISTVADERPVGFTCQSFASLSLDPPSVVFAPSRGSTTYPAVSAAGHFVANILDEGGAELARRFAEPDADRFREVGWRPGPTGAPMLDDALAWVACEIEAEHEAGDHLLVIGRVLHIAHADEGRPLAYYRGEFSRLEPPCIL